MIHIQGGYTKSPRQPTGLTPPPPPSVRTIGPAANRPPAWRPLLALAADVGAALAECGDADGAALPETALNFALMHVAFAWAAGSSMLELCSLPRGLPRPARGGRWGRGGWLPDGGPLLLALRWAHWAVPLASFGTKEQGTFLFPFKFSNQ